MIVFKCFVALIWSIVGFFMWIPLLTRIVLVYIFKVFYSTFSFEEMDSDVPRTLLENSWLFYSFGFKAIFAPAISSRGHHSSTPNTHRNSDRLMVNIVFAAFFWLSIFIIAFVDFEK